MTVKSLATELSFWEQITAAIESRLSGSAAERLLAQIGAIPIRRSRAVRSLGAYVSKAASPVCIRLQFAQEQQQLQETFLHEIAHACDHLCHQAGKVYRRAHGPGWRSWAESFGIRPERCGQSANLKQIHSERLKVVAVCRQCGAELQRLRRLNRRRNYIHTECGGRLRLL